MGQNKNHMTSQHKLECITWDHMGSHDPLLTSSGLKDCFMCVYLRNLAMGRMLEPVYIMMKKKTPVEKMRESWGLSWGGGGGGGGGRGASKTPTTTQRSANVF